MKRVKIKYLTIGVMLLLNLVAHAQVQYTVREVPNVQTRDAEQFVSDPERVLEYNDREALNEKLFEIRESLDVQTAIVVIPDIDEQYTSAKEFATELFGYWGLGVQNSDNGLLILLLTADGKREIVFETGYGIENTLSDGTSKLIQAQKMIPFLKEDAYGEGLIAGVDEIEKALKGTSELIKEPIDAKSMTLPIIIWLVLGVGALAFNESRKKKKVSEESSPYLGAIKQKSAGGLGCLLAVLFFPVFILFRLFKGGAKNAKIDCQSCKSTGTVSLKKGEPIIKQQAIPGQDGMKEYEFVCSKCGFVHKELVPYKYVKPQTESTNSGNNTTYRSGNFTKGGSWGGGKSGGGGASTKF